MIITDYFVSPEDSFESHDQFDRKATADGLTALVTASNRPTVIILDGEWGSGKSVFLRLWRNELRSKHPVIFLDAYARDYNNDPLFVIASEIISALRENSPVAARTFRSKAAGLAKSLAGLAAVAGVKAATAGMVSLDGVGDAADAVISHVGERATAEIEALLDAGSNHEKSLAQLKEELRQLPDRLGPKGVEDGKILIFIIDELDRCRPEFALRLIEVVKHFFDVPGIKFVIGANAQVLAASVKHTYGDIDGHRYLSRLVNHTFSLPAAPKVRSGNAISSFVRQTSEQSNLSSKQAGETVDRTISFFAEAGLVQLRDLTRIYTSANIAWPRSGINDEVSAVLFAVLCIMKTCQSQMFLKAQQGTLKEEEFANWIASGGSLFDSSMRDVISEYVGAFLRESVGDESQQILRFIRLPVRNRGDALRYLATGVVNAIPAL